MGVAARTLCSSVGLVAALAGCDGVTFGPRPFDALACVERALRGDPDPETLPLAFEHFTAECARGEPDACSALGILYERGLGVQSSFDRALRLYEQACAAESPAGCVNLVMLARRFQLPAASPDRAVVLLRHACDRDHAAGCAELGRMTLRGEGVVASAPQAARLYEKACGAGLATACLTVGDMYSRGPLPADVVQAVSRYEQACVGGAEEACDRMASLLHASKPQPSPAPVAELDCHRGDAQSCAKAALHFASAPQDERDLHRAMKLLRKACDEGYGPACALAAPMLHGACMRGDAVACAMAPAALEGHRRQPLGGPVAHSAPAPVTPR